MNRWCRILEGIPVRGKTIRFGYKLWCLCSSTGYLYSVIPYAGAEEKFDRNLVLGARTIHRFVEKIEFPNRHKAFFDIYFISYYLLCLLNGKRLCATGTVRNNHIGGADLKTGQNLPRGTLFPLYFFSYLRHFAFLGQFDAVFDKSNKILVCRWQDNKEVTVVTNYDGAYTR